MRQKLAPFSICGLVIALSCYPTTVASREQSAPFDQLRDVVGMDLFAAASASDLANGEPFVAELRVNEASETALAGVVWIAAPRSRYVAAVSDIEQFERGGPFRTTHRLADEPSADDFASLTLPPIDLNALRTCRIGRCDIKLDDATIAQLAREIDWASPEAPAAANDIVRQFALRLVRTYLERGNSGLPVYRDKDRPIAEADEFANLLQQASELGTQASEVRRYLADYPSVALPKGATSFLYWQLVDFGLKPVVRINHVVVWPRDSVTIVTSRLLYASHYFWTALETRFLLADSTRPGSFYFATVERSRSDGLTGFTGTLIGGTLRSHARQTLTDALEALRIRLITNR